MPDYDAVYFDPPAPLAKVILRAPQTGATQAEVPMLLDSGADVSLLPRKFVDSLGMSPVAGKEYELQAFDGTTSRASVVHLELLFLQRKFMGQFLLIDQSYGVLGRNILNNLVILHDGPNLRWGETKTE